MEKSACFWKQVLWFIKQVSSCWDLRLPNNPFDQIRVGLFLHGLVITTCTTSFHFTFCLSSWAHFWTGWKQMVSKANWDGLRTRYEFWLNTGFLAVSTCKGTNSCWICQHLVNHLQCFEKQVFKTVSLDTEEQELIFQVSFHTCFFIKDFF